MMTTANVISMNGPSTAQRFRSQSDVLSRVWSIAQRGLAAVLLVAISPLLAFLYVLVRGTSQGPFLFSQSRPGLSNRSFTIYKIRTMSVGTEQKTALGVTARSAEITRVGRVLRKLKLDELPQLWNIVRGDMALVGPRPLPEALFRELSASIPRFRMRGAVKPGLTNVSQVAVLDNALGDRLVDDWKLRFEGELHYIRHRSVAYDIVVLGMTVRYILRKLWSSDSVDSLSTTSPGAQSATIVAGTPVANLNYEQVVARTSDWVRTQSRRYVCICPVHSIVEAAWNPKHAEALKGAAINTADGVPVVWAQKLFGHRSASRVYGPTLMLQILERAARNGWRIALYGGHPERLETLVRRLMEMHPELNIVASISPPFRKLTDSEDQQMIQQLQDARPDVVFVGLGCPKQERWMFEHSSRVPGVMIGVGAAFDFHAGAVRQAPAVLQRAGLEWLFRLYCEPRRLFRRYATTNPAYIAMVARQFLASFVLRRRFQKNLKTAPTTVRREAA